MSADLVFPLQVVLGLITMSLLARWFVAPRLAGLPRASALQPLLAVHTLRYIGLVFLTPPPPAPPPPRGLPCPPRSGTRSRGAPRAYPCHCSGWPRVLR